ncbi:phage tail protein [Delftia sp.]|uniref:phage tail protein n=1 Tax=Delftia sp. TaxID=1886637 RepID=UPI00257C8567|nr:phage tail protein [Delftia sp.]MPT54957.1 phage tail protein [Delftia sp.]
MAYTVPDGSKLFISTVYGTAIAVTAVTNASPAVASAAAHGLPNGKEFIFTSGWDDANNRVFRVANTAAGTFAIDGLDTLNENRFTPGGGIGSVLPITTWQEIQQVLNPSTSGGDAQFAEVAPLASMNTFQIPTGFSATSITIPIGDDPSLPGYKAVKKASEDRLLVALKVLKPNGNVNYFYGYIALNEIPSLTKGQVDTVTAAMAPQGRTTRYAI